MTRRRALLSIALAIPLVAACAPTRWMESATLLNHLAFGVEPGRVERTVTPEADLYRSSSPPVAGIVLLPGVSPHGKDDPRLVEFAQAIAAARFAVVVPNLPELRELRVSASDAQPVIEAVRWLSAQEMRVGVGAFSYAVGPAMLAVLELPHDASFFLAIGGYHDIARVVAHFTGQEGDGEAKWQFLRANADRLRRPQDRQALTVLANRKLADPGAATDDLVKDLSPDGHAVLELITNRDPQRVPELIEALPLEVREELEALDLSRRDLSQLRAPLLLVHGAEDPIIPASESAALARAAPLAKLYILEDLSHVDAQFSPRDIATMYRTANALLRLRDGLGLR